MRMHLKTFTAFSFMYIETIQNLTTQEFLMGAKTVETDIYHSRISFYLRKNMQNTTCL